MGLFGKLFNSEKRDTTPNIEKFALPQETEAGGTLLPILRSRAGGTGVAFNPEELSMYGQPYAQAAMNYYRNQAMPAIDEQWSARGLGRSTMAGQANLQAQNELSDLIGTNWAELAKWNQALKQQGIQGALGGLQQFMGPEMQARQMNTQQKWQDYYNQLGIANQQKQNRAAGLMGMIQTGANLASLAFPPPLLPVSKGMNALSTVQRQQQQGY